jgi:hypothetical protein
MTGISADVSAWQIENGHVRKTISLQATTGKRKQIDALFCFHELARITAECIAAQR